MDGQELEGVTVIAQNSEQYTYFGRRPIRLSPGVQLDDGALGVVVLKRARPDRAAHGRVAGLLGPGRDGGRHRQIENFPGTRRAEVGHRGGTPSPCRWTATTSASGKQATFTAAPGRPARGGLR